MTLCSQGIKKENIGVLHLEEKDFSLAIKLGCRLSCGEAKIQKNLRRRTIKKKVVQALGGVRCCDDKLSAGR